MDKIVNIYKFIALTKNKELLESSDSEEESCSLSENTTSISATISTCSTATVLMSQNEIDTLDTSEEFVEELDVPDGKVRCEYCLKDFSFGGIKRHQYYCLIKQK